MPTANPLIEYSSKVAKAIDEKRPIVALESTIITHGMPWPQNLETAQTVESTVRENGAEPATIAIDNGKIHLGMEETHLESLAKCKTAMKLSRADLAFAIARGKTGSTTVAATMMASQLAGIEVFATGGIGGVHRDGENSMDVSADLHELAKTSVMVICAGAKAILDIPRTLEYLETHGVAVATFGSDIFPAFWSSTSEYASPLRIDSEEALVALWNTRKILGQAGGMLVANPVPRESEIMASIMEKHIKTALQDAQAEGIIGKAVTPYLLSKIVELTGGKSLETNIALIKNNAALAARIAVAMN